jgi:hypothetical protein
MRHRHPARHDRSHDSQLPRGRTAVTAAKPLGQGVIAEDDRVHAFDPEVTRALCGAGTLVVRLPGPFRPADERACSTCGSAVNARGAASA